MSKEKYFCRLLATFIAFKISEFSGDEHSFLEDMLASLKGNGFYPIDGLDIGTVGKCLINGLEDNDIACWIEDDIGYLHCSNCGYEVSKVQKPISCPRCKAYMED